MKIIEGEIAQQQKKLEAYESKLESLNAACLIAKEEYAKALDDYRAAAQIFEAAEIKKLDADTVRDENVFMTEFHLQSIDQLQDALRDDEPVNQQAEPSASAIQPMSQGAQ